MYLCLFEDKHVPHFSPLTDTRAVYDLRLARRTLLETTRDAFGAPQTILHARPDMAVITTEENDLLANRIPGALDVLFVNGRFIAEEGAVLERLRRAANSNAPARVFVQDDEVVAAWVPEAPSRLIEEGMMSRATFEGIPEEEVEGARLIHRLWDLLDELHSALERDYRALVRHNVFERPNTRIHESALLVYEEDIFIAPGAHVAAGVILNAEDGPIYIDRDASIMEQAVVRGPCYIGAKAQVKVAANISGSAIGYWSKVGGEVEESVIHSLSNKAHMGFLGHAYLGRWCNLGADTNNSNLKNDYGTVTLYNAVLDDFEDSGRQFLGLFMGDHSKCGIDTMFNTGTVIGVSCNLYGAGFMPRHIPSFSWGGPDGLTAYRLDKALRVAEAVMARRDRSLTDADRELMRRLAS